MTAFLVTLRRKNGKLYQYVSKRAKTAHGDEFEEPYDSAVARAERHFKITMGEYNAYSGMYEFDDSHWYGRESMAPDDMWVEEI